MAQPLNAEIKIYRSIRSYRDLSRTDSIGAVTKKLKPLLMSVPGREENTEVKFRDTDFGDFSAYMGEASSQAVRGYPVLIGLRDAVTFSTAQSNLPGVGFAYTIGQDKFIENTEDNLRNDLHQDLRDLA
jgi:hypothetical protein